MSEITQHVPVLPAEIMHHGHIGPGQRWVDGTAGGGGHARMIADKIAPTGKLLAIDRDPAAADRLVGTLGSHSKVGNASYEEIPQLLRQLEWESVDGILLDLGLSSDQLADRERGFSFQTDGELDMRFDPSAGEPVADWLARVDEKTLADTIYRYGEERFSRRIARRIVELRRSQPIRTASQLRDLVHRALPAARRAARGRGLGERIDPATRTFQALRIAINDELGILERSLRSLPDCLAAGGRLLIISFHSLEDRIVKYALREDLRLQVVTKKPVVADEAETASNPRSRSAKLRVAERL